MSVAGLERWSQAQRKSGLAARRTARRRPRAMHTRTTRSAHIMTKANSGGLASSPTLVESLRAIDHERRLNLAGPKQRRINSPRSAVTRYLLHGSLSMHAYDADITLDRQPGAQVQQHGESQALIEDHRDRAYLASNRAFLPKAGSVPGPGSLSLSPLSSLLSPRSRPSGNGRFLLGSAASLRSFAGAAFEGWLLSAVVAVDDKAMGDGVGAGDAVEAFAPPAAVRPAVFFLTITPGGRKLFADLALGLGLTAVAVVLALGADGLLLLLPLAVRAGGGEGSRFCALRIREGKTISRRSAANVGKSTVCISRPGCADALPEGLKHIVVGSFPCRLFGVLLALVSLEEVDLLAVEPPKLVGHLHFLVPLLALDILMRSRGTRGRVWVKCLSVSQMA